jgi:hypothetical protein
VFRARHLFLVLALAPCAAAGGTLNVHPSAPPAPREEQPVPGATSLPERASPEVGGRSEAEWRDAALARQRALESAEAALAACEASEAPAPYRDFSGYVTLGRRGPYWVEIKNCDDARLDVEAARREVDGFEEQARRSSVPPGWMR